MSEQWYCPNCGISSSKADYQDDMFICSGCDRQQFKRTPPAFVTEMQNRIAALEKVAEAAEGYCTGVFKTILGMERELSAAGYLQEKAS